MKFSPTSLPPPWCNVPCPFVDKGHKIIKQVCGWIQNFAVKPFKKPLRISKLGVLQRSVYSCEKCTNLWMNKLCTIFIINLSHAKFVMISDLQIENQANLTFKEINKGPC
jgi:hypothetical protein